MAFDPTLTDLDDLPPLYEALTDRNFDRAAKLVAAGARLDDLIEDDGDSLLHRAAQDGDMPMVAFYLEHGCPETLEQFDFVERTPLIRAAAHGHTDVVVRLLAAGANPNGHDEKNAGDTAIHEAVREGHAQIVSLLLRAGADPTIRGGMGMFAVDHAWHDIKADSGTMREIRCLLKPFPSSLRDRVYEQNRK